MHYLSPLFAILVLIQINILAEKLDLDILKNYSEFVNLGNKKFYKVNKDQLENAIFKSKIQVLGKIFKKNLDILKVGSKLDIVFLIDASSSVGEVNFQSELKFVKKVLSDIPVDYNHTRIAVVTFSSENNIVKNIDEISNTTKDHNKCLLLNTELKKIKYSGGETFTIGAFRLAKEIFSNSNRNDSKRVLFLITDGYSSGGDPTQLAEELKNNQITIFTIGIENGNYKELYDISSSPGEFYSYLLDSYNEFESLARRALHVDLHTGEYIPVGFNEPCNILCEEKNCCDSKAVCSCGTTTGHYSCVCEPGYYGSGLKSSCFPCTRGTYSDGPNLCLPCPDPLHTTVPPAVGIKNCKCKPGYKSTKNHRCKEIRCPALKIPENGYVVNECLTVINAACGIRCDVGYNLKGTSIRLCQPNGTWSGIDPVCEIRTCVRPNLPKDAEMKCYHPDLEITYKHNEINLPMDAECTFKCPVGKYISGSKLRICLPLALWDGLNTTCRSVKCNKLPEFKFGKIDPPSCTKTKQVHGQVCKVTCLSGFKLGGPSEKKCGGADFRGTWDSNFEDTTCTDVIPPKLNCPDNIVTKTLPGRNFAQTFWETPNVTDNTNLNVTVWTKPAIENITEFKFQIGNNTVTYYAQDAYKNYVQCSFEIKVKDEEPPVIENCIDPPSFLTNDPKGANVTWDEPHIFDNSQNVLVNRSRSFGLFEIGTTIVTYSAIDLSGNKNFCKLNITVEDAHCDALPDPIFGQSECLDRDDGIQCLITCQEGYAIPLSHIGDYDNGTNFICQHTNPNWYNVDGMEEAECSVTKVPEDSIQNGEFILQNSTICNDTDQLKQVENDITNFINNEICVENCTIDITTECEREHKEEEFNKILRKRQTDFEAVPHRNKSKKRKKVNVKFQVRGKLLNETKAIGGNVTLQHGYNASVKYGKSKFICPHGFFPRKNRCVQCPRGTFHNVTRNKCQSCLFGTYTDKLGQMDCTSCPLHFSTRKIHSKKLEDCQELCPPGTHARRKLIKYSKQQPNKTIERTTLKPHCRSCNFGSYQHDYGQLKCLPCPKGYTTPVAGAHSIEQCFATAEEICRRNNSCINGVCMASNEYQYTCNCFENYIGTHCEKLINLCDSDPCFNGATCVSSRAGFICLCKRDYTGRFCEESIEECKKNCKNNGLCVSDQYNESYCKCTTGYSGELCEDKISYCSSSLCENGGTCMENDGNFKCICTKGYIGKRCTILPCDYRPCEKNYMCRNDMIENATKNNYECVCPDGYTGTNCNELIDHCKSSPCENEGSCTNKLSSYSCNCSKLYHGVNCEYKRNIKYVLNFTRFDTNDYIKLKGFTGNISEITACLWIQTTDNFNYGTLISYATRTMDNAFTITDYTGLVLYVNNNYVVMDVLLNDGFWHHLCLTWRNTNGTFEVFVDGQLTKTGQGLSPDTYIEGDGNMIIGQEQDVIGGKFSLAESFTGKLAYIDVWSKILNYEEIHNHFSDCSETLFGDLYGWPEIQENIHGNVQILNSSFCGKCIEPRPLFNGLIEINANIAYYSCYKGYILSNPKFLQGRKCTKASKWEGTSEPYCKRIYCGYPGFIRNGYPLGNKYYYNDEILYRCFPNYNLTGNEVISCRENGKWYPEKPQCIGIQCFAFKQPLYSNLTIMSDHSYEDYIEDKTKFDPGTQIEITCDEKANLTGENIITCMENGTWDFEPPKCMKPEESKSEKLNCDIKKVPPAPNNGYIEIDSLYAVGNGTTDFVQYKCRQGYKLHGDNSTTCIVDGYWTEPRITCDVIVCDKPNLLKNMITNQGTLDKPYHFGNMIKVQCEEGYNVFGSNTIRCLTTGKWSRIQGKCIKKSCKKPNVESGTTIQGKSYLYGDKVKISCNSGATYELICNKLGIWEGEKDDSC